MSAYRGSGGPNGDRVWWPAGLAMLTPRERADALTLGSWLDGDRIVMRDGRCLAAVFDVLAAELADTIEAEHVRNQRSSR